MASASIGVRTMASMGDAVVQSLHCPVLCGGAGQSAAWFPCGASSGIASAARIDGHEIAISRDDVYVDGALVEVASAPFVILSRSAMSASTLRSRIS